MVLYVGSFVTCCIGFQILYMCSSYAWSEDGCHSGMSYVLTTGAVCCTFIKRAVPLRNFAVGERLAFCLRMFLRIASCTWSCICFVCYVALWPVMGNFVAESGSLSSILFIEFYLTLGCVGEDFIFEPFLRAMRRL